MTNADEPFQLANEAAHTSAQAALVALGISQMIDEFRFSVSDAGPVPAPGLEDSRTAALAAYAEAIDAFLSAENLVPELDQPEALDPENGSARQHLDAAARRGGAATDRAASAARRLAQLALGVTANASWSDATARLERAAMSTIVPQLGVEPVYLANDEWTLHARHRDDLRVELAGAMTRLLLEWGGGFTLQLPVDEPRGVRFEVVETTLLGWAVGAPPSELVDAGWDEPDDDGAARSRWPSPVTVAEPADLAVTTLYDVLGLGAVDDLTVVVDERDPARAP